MEYPWYELIENSTEITQGDILKNCPGNVCPVLHRLCPGRIQENDADRQ